VTIGGGGVGTTANSGNSNLQEIQTGIELNVTPQISESEFIKLDILATESEADFTRAIDGIPAVVDSTASTSVMLKNGETTIIGGLFKVKDAKTVKGIPGLMKVPLVGNLFKSKSKAKAKSELLIFITPRVVESGLAELPHFEEPESAYTTSKPAEEPKATVRKRKHHQ
jgi:type IV pilus assembly protein PilQ